MTLNDCMPEHRATFMPMIARDLKIVLYLLFSIVFSKLNNKPTTWATWRSDHMSKIKGGRQDLDMRGGFRGAGIWRVAGVEG